MRKLQKCPPGQPLRLYIYGVTTYKNICKKKPIIANKTQPIIIPTNANDTTNTQKKNPNKKSYAEITKTDIPNL